MAFSVLFGTSEADESVVIAPAVLAAFEAASQTAARDIQARVTENLLDNVVRLRVQPLGFSFLKSTLADPELVADAKPEAVKHLQRLVGILTQQPLVGDQNALASKTPAEAARLAYEAVLHRTHRQMSDVADGQKTLSDFTGSGGSLLMGKKEQTLEAAFAAGGSKVANICQSMIFDGAAQRHGASVQARSFDL